MSFTENNLNNQHMMPSKIALKLCRDFVDSSFNSSSKDNSKIKSNANIARKQKSNNKLKKSFPVITQKVTNEKKISPVSRSNLHNLKSKAKVLTSDIVNIGINTLISGPLRCDNNCVTLVRRRDHPPTCKCAQKKTNPKLQEKDIQATVHKICIDRACTNSSRSKICLNEVFRNNSYTKSDKSRINIKKRDINVLSKPSKSYGKPKLIDFSPLLNISTRDVTSSCNEISINETEKFQGTHQLCNIRNVGAQRWSITNYPMRGPDF